MNSATRSVTKRISMVSVASGSVEEHSKSASDDKSVEKPITDNDQLLAELVKKVKALETYKREAEERSRWREKKQQWKNNRTNNKNDRQSQGNNGGNRPAVRQVNVSDEQDPAPADDSKDGES